MQVSLQVALILKRIAPMRCLLSLFAAVLGLGCCQNVRADSMTVVKQFDDRIYGGNGLEFQADQMGNVVLLDPGHAASDFDTSYRNINVPALPAGAVVTSATFSLIPLDGTLHTGNGFTWITGSTTVQPGFVSATSLNPYGGPCLPPSCAPTIATISVAYQYDMGLNCLGFLTCFKTSASTDLLALGVPRDYFANGFGLGTNDSSDALIAQGAVFDQILYPGFNSQTIVDSVASGRSSRKR